MRFIRVDMPLAVNSFDHGHGARGRAALNGNAVAISMLDDALRREKIADVSYGDDVSAGFPPPTRASRKDAASSGRRTGEKILRWARASQAGRSTG